AQAVTSSHGPPLTDTWAGGAESWARPVTVTGTPDPSVICAGSGSWQTVAGPGAGIRPGQGRSGGSAGSWASPNGTSVTCSAGLRPPASTGRGPAGPPPAGPPRHGRAWPPPGGGRGRPGR